MAGAGFKTFGVGDVLTASDVNTYLMQQSVMSFADSGARGSAIGTAVLSEGMVSYLADTDAVEVYDGSAWTAVGSDPNPGIGTNVVQTVNTTTFIESVAQGGISGDAITASITPSSATSKVLVIAHLSLGQSSDVSTMATLYRGGSVSTFIGDGDGNRQRVTTGAEAVAYTPTSASFAALDSPATTSSTTYSVRLSHNASATQSVKMNYAGTDTNATYTGRGISTLTLIEVAV